MKSRSRLLKLASLLLVLIMTLSLAACTNDEGESKGGDDELAPIAKEDLKVGFIYNSVIGDEGYTYAHNLGRLALEDAGIETMYLENVPENSDCEKAARDLIEQGCNVIYAISYGHGEWIANVADEYPNVYFNHATGNITKTNMSTYMGRLYEPQYLAGIAAGLKTESNKIGYVTTFPIAEVIRQVNSFTLGVKSVNPDATVEVKWTSSWFDPVAEKSASTELLNSGCDVISAYCDTMNPQITAASAGAFAIGCSTPGYDVIPNSYLTAPIFNWATFYTENVESIIDGTWTGDGQWLGMSTGLVALDELSDNCEEGTKEAVESVKAEILDGSFYIFSGEIKDNEGNVRVEEGESLTDEQLLALDWFVEGVIGSTK